MRLWSIQDTQKESICIVTCYHKSVSTVWHQCLENGKKTLCPVPKENHANASWNASWTEYLQYLRRTEKQWHNISRCFGNWHTRYELRVFFGLLNRLHMLCHCFSERWSFFTFSSETFDWHCRYTFVITRINAIISFCVSLMDKNSIHSLFTSVTLHCAYSTE